jgi:predicted nuclease of predicted toxin-antitoxin system
MRTYLLKFYPSLPIIHVSTLGNSPSDSQIWQYAKDKELVIVTKDVDFSDRLMLDLFPPKVVHLRFGNIRKSLFRSFLASVWTQVEELVTDHKLINIYLDRIEAFK